jgi:hypothetical protein
MLQDRLEDYIDVSVGNAKKIEPTFLVEERLDYLIIGDSIDKVIPSLEIQNWIRKYGEISKNTNFIVKALSGFYIMSTINAAKSEWNDFLQGNIDAEIYFPPILDLKLNKTKLALEEVALELVNDYSNTFIGLFISKQQMS